MDCRDAKRQMYKRHYGSAASRYGGSCGHHEWPGFRDFLKACYSDSELDLDGHAQSAGITAEHPRGGPWRSPTQASHNPGANLHRGVVGGP